MKPHHLLLVCLAWAEERKAEEEDEQTKKGKERLDNNIPHSLCVWEEEGPSLRSKPTNEKTLFFFLFAF